MRGSPGFLELTRREPYRIFFPLGILGAMLGTALWLGVALGAWPYDARLHGLIQIEAFGAAYVVGFLLTALPKFCRAPTASFGELFWMVLAFLAAQSSMLAGSVLVSQLSFALLMSLVSLFVSRCKRTGTAAVPASFEFVSAGILCGISGASLLALDMGMFTQFGRLLLQQGMLPSFIVAVGGFLGPRLMGRVESTPAIVRLRGSGPSGDVAASTALPLHLLWMTGLIITFIAELNGLFRLAYALRALLVIAALKRFNALGLPTNKTLIAKIIALALFLLPVGLLAVSVFPENAASCLHVTYIGSFSLIMLGIGAQITSSHGGDPEFWARRRLSMHAMVLLLLGAMLIRVTSSWTGAWYLNGLALASTLLLGALFLWTTNLARLLARAPG